MTVTPHTPMTCDEFDALLPDLLEGTLDVVAREAAESHAEGCTRCRGLLGDLQELRGEASRLPVLAPSRDLWDGISARIETPAIELNGRTARRWWQRPSGLAAAAVVLITVTAGVTWTLASRHDAEPLVSTVFVPVQLAAAPGTPAFDVAGAYDRQIAELRTLLASRPGTLDTATARIVALNLGVIDDAIARVRFALDSAPANLSLTQQLARAYEMKLNMLRQAAAMPTTE
jgi:hypothetical protein